MGGSRKEAKAYDSARCSPLKRLCVTFGGTATAMTDWEFVPANCCLFGPVVSKQLGYSKKFDRRRPIVLLYDNAKPHTANVVKTALLGFDCILHIIWTLLRKLFSTRINNLKGS